jgi:prepilin-type N-terminal cleavage/methylation domain-containing protein
MIKTNKKGFTLIELLATIVIVGIILTISIVGVNTYINKGKEKGLVDPRALF